MYCIPTLLVVITLHISGSLSAHHQEFWDVHRLWYSCHPTPGSIRFVTTA